MTENLSDTSQNTALRDKFVSVVGPVFEGGDEENVLTLLTSLTNVCRNDAGLLVKPLDDDTIRKDSTAGDANGKDKASEFTCWLLAELITVHGSPMVCEANVNLQVTIMRLLDSRNPKLFLLVMKDYVRIGLEGKEVLFDGQSVTAQSFPSVVDPNNAQLKPKAIQFADDSQLDHSLAIINLVLGQLGDLLHHFGSLLGDIWLLVSSCLEGGDTNLKVSSLTAINHLLDTCGLPVAVERTDYFMQCVGGMVLLLASSIEEPCSATSVTVANTSMIKQEPSSAGAVTSQNERSIAVPLAEVVMSLKEHIPDMIPFFQEEFLVMMYRVFSPANVLEKMPEVLRKPLVECYSLLIDSLATASPHLPQATSVLEACVSHSILVPEVASLLFRRLVLAELLDALPTPAADTQKPEASYSHTRKRKFSEMESSMPPVTVTNISKWWKMALQKLSTLFAVWSESPYPPLEQIEAVNIIISNTGWLSANIPPSKVCLQFLPEAWLLAATDVITTVMTSTEDICQVVEMLKLLVTLAWTSCIVEPGEVKSALCHSWLALATLPWMTAEVTWMDLKPANSRNFTQWATKIKWTSDPRVRSQSVVLVALLPECVAPRWRCHVVRSLISEQQPQVMVEVAAWFPMIVHQLHGANGQHLVGEVTGAVLLSSDSATVLAAAHCFRPLLCSLLSLTSVKPLRDDEDSKRPYTLHCQVCDEASSPPCLATQGVDSTLVSRFLGLLGHPEAPVVVAVVEALPTVVTHSTLTSHMVSQYLALLTHQNKAVVSALCEQLPALICVKEQNPNQDSKSLSMTRDGEMVMSHFNGLVRESDGGGAASTQHVMAVLQALKNMVRRPLGGLTSGVLVLLLRCLFLKVRTVSSTAHLVIHSLAKTLDLSLKDLYARHRQALSQVLSGAVCQGEVAGLLSHVADVFKWPELSMVGKRNLLNTRLGAFISSQLHYLLPALVVRAAKETKPGLLQELASCLGYRLRDILIDHFQHILAHLVFHHSEEEQEAVLNFIAATTEIQIFNIRRCSVQNQVNELVLGLHDHQRAVLREFHHMRAIDTSSASSTSFSSANVSSSKNLRRKNTNELSGVPCQEDICEYLAPRLLGILGFLDSKLVSSSTMFKEKRSALWSLNDLLALMGKKYISPVSRKVLASLKTALKLKDEEFYDISCHAWANFLLNLDECTLEGLVEEVVVVVMPLIQKRPEQMEPVLTRVLVETPSVKPLLGNLPLLPAVEALERINLSIMESQSRVAGGSSEEVLYHLSGILKGLSHESVDVRLSALGRLRSALHHNQDAVHHLTIASDNVHPTVSELFSALLGQCREVDEDVQVLVAECLGLLGAIDPSRLYSFSNIKEELNEIHLNIENEAFIVQLITELGRAFLAATDASTQTCASYALQEITRLYGIRESGSEEATAVGSRTWEQLRYHLQEIIHPLLTSKYTVATGSGRPTPVLPSPIFGSPHAASFHQWLTSWECSLVDMLKGERASQVFSVCKPILRRDTTTAMYLLPSILVCVLCEAQHHHSCVLDEVLAVMNHMQEKEDDSSKKEDSSAVLSSEFKQLAVQTVFSALDYISKWTQKQRQAESLGKKGRGAFVPSTELQQIMSFLEKIPADILAQTSYKTQSYSRALLHIEAFLKDNPNQLKEHLHFLQRIYVSLDEPDGVAGVAAIRRDDPSLEEQVIQHEATGQLQDALGCYERLCVSQGTEAVYKGLLECYISLDQPHSVLNITQGLLSTRPELEPSLNKYRVEAAWRLSKWDELETFLKATPEQPSWGMGVGQVLRAVRAREHPAYLVTLKSIRAHHISLLSAASMEKWAYQRAYPYILRLHMLTELEEMVSGLLSFNPSVAGTLRSSSSRRLVRVSQQAEGWSELEGQQHQHPLDVGELIDLWDKRLGLIQTSHRYLEPILSFRRTLLALGSEWLQETNPAQSAALRMQLERTWLHSAKVARKAGHTQQGEWALLGAGFGRDVFVERAKWHWVKGEHHQAVTTLNRGIDKFFPVNDTIKGDNRESSQEERLACGRAKLLLAKYSEEAATLDSNTIKQYYRDACEMNRQWEDGHFHLAMYYDRILSSLEKKEKPVEWIHHIILSFGKSLQHGCCHIYQSMPRMLGLWLEFGTRVSELEAREGKSVTTTSSKNISSLELLQEKLSSLNGAIGSMVDRLPHYMFLTALPQLISRICHSHNDVFKQLCKIIANMLSTFPQQAMWHMVAVSKSSYHMRVARCSEIFETAKKINSSLSKFIADATKLADKFLELSNKPVEKGVPQASLNNLLRALPRLLADTSFSNIMLPLQHQMAVMLPSASDDLKSHNPFPRTPVYLSSIEDKVEIMQSLQLPKKITLRGSDGKCYIMMCKPKDDLRKDCRLMEFNNFVNRLLFRDPESRKRDLHIRTYAVVPLNEECGLIEWIENLHGLRQILHRLYKDSGKYMPAQELKQNMCKRDTPLATKREVYLNKLVPRHPPVFGTWFLRTFPDPQAWLRARLAYCRTTAVMSMVGYILGLGDRHGENVLFDASCGDTVHVDFNCLFNKGETFDFPERVPFRLTQNMVAAMGPTGHEGIYRKACEVTMRVMREEREALMSVLHPFIHDPLVEWSRGNKSARTTGEINNEKAQMHVTNIEHRLSGQIRSKARGLNQPLSVEGQVNSLIDEATSIDNLCQMYIGWAAYM